ncbi:diguanylate cyclase domain-containing protein [Cryobacterium tepidiphilum]|uniref:Diguanylate cyclase n=1 Tax=Cryobacterium tepidiphilum TaxID=2486026 RepID=A0A3M8LPM0_9MICO|nr:diguanylate cyclase [Cryobacterium tepidiphilum]RNE66769.1 diguanylate cyclase [Cryobacterium tepidiphilum]
MNEDRWRDLFHRAPCGLLSMTVDGAVNSVNDTFLELIGSRHEHIVDTYFMEHLSNGSKLFFETRFMPLLRLHGQVREMALELVRPDGSKLAVFVNSTLVTTDASSIVHTAVFDATARQDYERDLLEARRSADRSLARLKVLEGAARVFASAMTEEDLGAGLAAAAQSATDATNTSVLLVRNPGELELVAGEHPVAARIDLAGLCPEAEAVRAADAVVCASPVAIRRRFPAAVDALFDAKVESLCVVPLVEDEAVRGVLVCHFGRTRTLDDSVRKLLTALCDQASAVLQRIRLQQQVRHQSLHDVLTGLPNRSALQSRLEQVLSGSVRHGRPIAVIFVDLDGFKAINDSLGHQYGDQVLRQISDRLSRVVRAEETVGRLGGDEFLIICEDIDEDDARAIADRAREDIAQPLEGMGSSFPLSASVGICVYRPSEGNAPVTGDQLVRLADNAMYESKRAGKDRSTVVLA